MTDPTVRLTYLDNAATTFPKPREVLLQILHYFAFFERSEKMVPAFDAKPEALLRMVLMLLRHGDSGPWFVDGAERETCDCCGKAIGK